MRAWGGLTAHGNEQRSDNLPAITERAILSRGLGRSYGDSSLPPVGSERVVANTTLADRLLSLDESTAVLHAEAGLSLWDLNPILLRRNLFVPVTPGTQFVTLGGMVASDVHGKNHHVAGCFGEHVQALTLRVASGDIVQCSRTEHPELFRATLGGMGLTGHVHDVRFCLERIPSPWIHEERIKVKNLDAFIEQLKQDGHHWPFTVGWIDCLSQGPNLGRGLLFRGRWATPEEAPDALPKRRKRLAVPIHAPSWTLNDTTVRHFNNFIYHSASDHSAHVVTPYKFFYPLDRILHWNRIYGKRGFTQYQCVLPETGKDGAARRFLELLTRKGGSSFLCVIKDCGDEGHGLLSFPKPGISIAVDLPIRRHTQALVDELNEHVIGEGGRMYLTKDTFTRPEHFAAMEPRLATFQDIRRRWDPNLLLRSAQSVRVLNDPPEPSWYASDNADSDLGSHQGNGPSPGTSNGGGGSQHRGPGTGRGPNQKIGGGPQPSLSTGQGHTPHL